MTTEAEPCFNPERNATEEHKATVLIGLSGDVYTNLHPLISRLSITSCLTLFVAVAVHAIYGVFGELVPGFHEDVCTNFETLYS